MLSRLSAIALFENFRPDALAEYVEMIAAARMSNRLPLASITFPGRDDEEPIPVARPRFAELEGDGALVGDRIAAHGHGRRSTRHLVCRNSDGGGTN